MARRYNPDRAINDNADRPEKADDNVIQPFQLEKSKLRGRAVRLGSVLDEILGPHDYPETVAILVAETIVHAALLSSMLKYDGIFTLQTRGDGPVGMLVADMTSKGEIRGCASFDAGRVEKFGDVGGLLPLLLGKGHIAFTVDQSEKADRYQGIVELKGKSLVECVQHYFRQSEQIVTGIDIAVEKTASGWRAGGIMLQHMPEDEKGAGIRTTEERNEDWNRAMTLLATCKSAEILDPALHSRELLLRLFHEEGVRVYKPLSLTKGCRCDAGKIEKILAGLPEEDIEYLEEKGTIKMRCEFCSRDFTLEPDVLKKRPRKGGSEKSPKKKK